MSEIVTNFKQPTTTAQFETEISSFKEHHDKLLQYLLQQDLGVLKGMYSRKQIESSLILRIVKSLSQIKDSSRLSSEKVHGLFLTFSKAKGFKLSSKMLLKKEKEQLRELFSKMGAKEGSDLYKAYNLIK